MTNAAENNKRIAKNTLLLYFRMLFTMAVSLYTSRVVLNTLGVEDFGIYNVVGGIVVMFGFINNAMAAGTYRFLAFELGRKDYDRLKTVFSTSIIIHALISLFVVALAETVGLWFFYEKMIIPADRLDAAMWVYQFSIVSTVVLMMSVPYNASIIAHEKMSAFAYISVLEVVLKLAIVYLLTIGSLDKLKLYAVLTFLVQLFIRMVYGFYCNRHFDETKFRCIWDGKLFREMTSFATWSLLGNCAVVCYTHGLNLLLNMFFGPVVNAARGVAVQVQHAVTQFSSSFQMALNPQITKSYAAGDRDYLHNLIFRSSKFSFYLLLLLCLPVLFEAETMLRLWLKTVPDYTVLFLRLILCITIIDAVANPIMTSANATGRVREYQSVVGGLLLTIEPLSYVALKLGGRPESVFVVHLCVCVVVFIARLYIVRPMIGLVLSDYFRKVLLCCLFVTVASLLLPLAFKIFFYDGGLISVFTECLLCMLSVAISAFYLGLTTSERGFILNKLSQLKSKFRE